MAKNTSSANRPGVTRMVPASSAGTSKTTLPVLLILCSTNVGGMEYYR